VVTLDLTNELTFTKLKSTLSCRINGQWYPHFLFHNLRVVFASITTSNQNFFTVILIFLESSSSVATLGLIRNASTPSKLTILPQILGNDLAICLLNFLVSKLLFFLFLTHYRLVAKSHLRYFLLDFIVSNIFQGMSWPPRSSRSLNASGMGANSLPLGSLNDPMNMGGLRDSLGSMSKVFKASLTEF